MEGNRRPWSDNFEGSSEYIYELIAKDASINAKDQFGKTPLHLVAAKGGQKEVAELLKKHGAR